MGRHVVVMAALWMVALLAPTQAHAQTAVIVNRQALAQEMEELTLDLDALEQLNASHPNARVKGRVTAGLASMRARLVRLRAVLDAAPVSSAPSPVVVVTPPPRDRPRQDNPPPPAAPQAMDAARFADLTADIKKAPFADGKLDLVRDAVAHHHFNVDQVVAVMQLIPMSSDKVEAAALMHPRLVDPQDFFKVYKHIPFSGDQDALRARVGR